ncbi:hypothetical protein ARMGADRAFT_1084652 [Armillaria gallica]|uniref:Uncharacterized protein n=1 Tax=Armillaria gallica TaxID=47427 RepID=A0A2H3DA72_ARMGA|nr:hypothetical protein ARMGADRAFT_1084652 [Armillaria gallica]
MAASGYGMPAPLIIVVVAVQERHSHVTANLLLASLQRLLAPRTPITSSPSPPNIDLIRAQCQPSSKQGPRPSQTLPTTTAARSLRHHLLARADTLTDTTTRPKEEPLHNDIVLDMYLKITGAKYRDDIVRRYGLDAGSEELRMDFTGGTYFTCTELRVAPSPAQLPVMAASTSLNSQIFSYKPPHRYVPPVATSRPLHKCHEYRDGRQSADISHYHFQPPDSPANRCILSTNVQIIDRFYPVRKAHQLPVLGVVHGGDLKGTEILEGVNGYGRSHSTSSTTISTATRARAGCRITRHEAFQSIPKLSTGRCADLKGSSRLRGEPPRLGVCAARESRARLHDVMSRVSKWTTADAMKWDDAAEEEVLQSQSPHFNDENACAEASTVRCGSSIVRNSNPVRQTTFRLDHAKAFVIPASKTSSRYVSKQEGTVTIKKKKDDSQRTIRHRRSHSMQDNPTCTSLFLQI